MAVDFEQQLGNEQSLSAGPVKTEWLNAFIAGNRLFPQMYLAISTLLVEAAAKDPQAAAKMPGSKLNLDQTVTLATRLNKAHQSFGVPFRYVIPGIVEADVEEDKKIPPASIDRIWRTPTTLAGRSINDFMMCVTGDEFAVRGNQYDQFTLPGALDGWMKNPRNEVAVTKLQTVSVALGDYLRRGRGRQYSGLMRAGFTWDEKKWQRIEAKVLAKAEELDVDEEAVRPHFMKPDERGQYFTDLLMRDMRNLMEEKYPEATGINWINVRV